ncbi:MAG: hypothetical protein MO846_02390 [Candidatus Devosia symbiotica]|nr:hypothetical protein [Candidatus Devosia symbiotica]
MAPANARPAKGGIPKIMLGGMKERSGNSSRENARLANRMRSDATEIAS